MHLVHDFREEKRRTPKRLETPGQGVARGFGSIPIALTKALEHFDSAARTEGRNARRRQDYVWEINSASLESEMGSFSILTFGGTDGIGF